MRNDYRFVPYLWGEAFKENRLQVMEIATMLTGETLTAINQLWPKISFREESPNGKLAKSICKFTATRFLKKQVARMDKNPRKKFTITLQYFEAAVISTYLFNAANRELEAQSLERTLISTYCNEIRQKL